jgi:hypothetical protein
MENRRSRDNTGGEEGDQTYNDDTTGNESASGNESIAAKKPGNGTASKRRIRFEQKIGIALI